LNRSGTNVAGADIVSHETAGKPIYCKQLMAFAIALQCRTARDNLARE